MTVEVTPDKELALHILVAEVGTVVGFGRHTYLSTADRAFADGGVEEDTAVLLQGQQRRKRLSCL